MRQERMVVLASQRRYAATGSPANRRRWPKPAIHHRSGDSLSPPAPARLDLTPALERMDVGMGVGMGMGMGDTLPVYYAAAAAARKRWV
jgi:hypothetical protein